MTTIYDYPRLYELAFSFRDIEEEADFIHKCINKFSRIPVKSILEIGSGHAPHAGALSKIGYKYIGLDKNPTMITYAKEKWRSLVPSPRFIHGNMEKFQTDHQVEFAYVMLGSLYLNSNEQLSSHFKSVADAMPSGGLYFLDWCVQVSDPMAQSSNNNIVIARDGVTIESHFEISMIDQIRQLYKEEWTVNISDNGERKTLQMIEKNRAMFPQEFLLFVENCTDFELVGWWHNWDLDNSLDSSGESTRPLVILRRL